jgi:hypothetical protein
VSWKRADGLEKSKTCDHSVIGVVVVGAGRGQAFAVCVNKEKCDVHWKAERKQREQRAAAPATKVTAAPREDEWEKRRQREDAERKQFDQARPRLVAASVEKLKTAKLPVLVDIVAGRFMAENTTKARKLLGGAKTAEDILRVFALSEALNKASNSWSGVRDFPKLAKALGLDYRKLLKGDAEKPAAKKAAKASAVKSAKAKKR